MIYQSTNVWQNLLTVNESKIFITSPVKVNTSIAAITGAFARTSYLVGASDKIKEGAFEWCTSDLPANVSPLLKWKTGQPDNLNNAENCVNIIASSGIVPNNILLSDLSCDTTKMKFLCEVRVLPARGILTRKIIL